MSSAKSGRGRSSSPPLDSTQVRRQVWQRAVRSPAGPVASTRKGTRTLRLVLFVLSTYGDDQGGHIVVSTATLAAALPAHRDTVEGYLVQAERMGWIWRKKLGRDPETGRWRGTRYALVLPEGVSVPINTPAGTVRGNSAAPSVRDDNPAVLYERSTHAAVPAVGATDDAGDTHNHIYNNDLRGHDYPAITSPAQHVSSDTPTACEAARHYTGTMIWHLIPLPAGCKGPRRPGWQEHAIYSPEVAEDLWSRDPRRGMGLYHGSSGTCAIDLDADEEYVARALAAGGVDYGAVRDTGGPRIVGNPAHPAKYLFRVPDGVDLRRRALSWPDPADPTRRLTVFELRAGRGIQDVLPPSVHPDTGEPYRWGGSGRPESPGDVPVLPDEVLALWQDWNNRLPAMVQACPWGEDDADAVAPNGGGGHARPGLIATYNDTVPIERVLARNGYRQCSDGKWLSPWSTSGVAGVAVLDSGAYSHHASDPMCDGWAHNAFDAMRILEHAGDVQAAVRAARAEMGPGDRVVVAS